MAQDDGEAETCLDDDQQELINRFAGKGLAGFIQKPYRPAQLADKLREVLVDE